MNYVSDTQVLLRVSSTTNHNCQWASGSVLNPSGCFFGHPRLSGNDPDLPSGSELYADNAYTDYQLEDNYADCEQIYLRVQRKKSALRVDQPHWVYLKKQIRQKIEQTFSQITARFPKHIHAVTAEGFILKIVLFLLIHNFDNLL